MEFYDLNVKRGETFRQVLLFKEADGSARDLTGCEGFCQVRPEPESEVLIASMGVAIEGTEGRVTLSLSSEITSELETGVYAYDLALLETDGRLRYYVGGKFTVLPSVTKVNGE